MRPIHSSGLLRYVCAPTLLFAVAFGGSAGIGRAGPLDGAELVMGPLPTIDHNAPLDAHVLETTRMLHYLREKITFVSEPGSIVHAWLLIPFGANHSPAMLCLHETTQMGSAEPAGLNGNPNMHYADELAQRGYVTLAPDYPHYGEDKTNYQTDVYGRGYVSGSMKGVVNHIRAVDLLASMPEVDPQRIGVIGHSLGGHNSLFVAAFDPRIRVAVISCGFTSKMRNASDFQGDASWAQEVYMPLVAIRYHLSARELPFDFSDFFEAIAPRPVFINSPWHDEEFDPIGVDECIARVSRLFPDHELVVVHPNCPHDFPPEIREQAYRFLDRVLK